MGVSREGAEVGVGLLEQLIVWIRISVEIEIETEWDLGSRA